MSYGWAVLLGLGIGAVLTPLLFLGVAIVANAVLYEGIDVPEGGGE